MVERETSTQNKQVLKRLLAEPSNKTCVDCKTATHPRWASWNLGVFLCIRCSGVHRSLGTHISKVRSVDLDSWTDMHLKEMVRWGNRRANLYWEAKLPPNYVPDESKIVNFIKTKYDLKRWVASSAVPDPASLDAMAEDVPLSEVQNDLRPVVPPKVRSNPVTGPSGARPAARSQPDLLGDFGASSAPSRPAAPAVSLGTAKTGPVIGSARQSHFQSGSLLDLDGPTTSAPSAAPSATQSATQSASRPAPFASKFSGQPAAPAAAPTTTQAPRSEPRADLKKSILSLYAQRPSPAPSTASAPAAVSAPVSAQPAAGPATVTKTATTDSLFDLADWTTPAPAAKPTSSSSFQANDFAGLSLNPSTAAPSTTTNTTWGQPATTTPAFTNTSTYTTAARPSGYGAPQTYTNANANENAGVAATTSTVAIEDDDVFANVWK